MRTSKIERAIHGPSWTEVILGAVLSVLLGLVLAVCHLVLKPVATVRELPKELVAGQIYYIEGSRDATKGRGWLAKRQAFCSGQSVELSEEELNTAVVSPTEKPPAEAAAASQEAMLSPGLLNFRIADGKLHFGVPLKTFLLDRPVILQARGSFVLSGEQFRFEPELFYLGSCPLHKIPLLRSALLKRVPGAQSIPEDLRSAWSKLSAVSIEGRVLKLSMP